MGGNRGERGEVLGEGCDAKGREGGGGDYRKGGDAKGC